jgi:hypothetical protein
MTPSGSETGGDPIRNVPLPGGDKSCWRGDAQAASLASAHTRRRTGPIYSDSNRCIPHPHHVGVQAENEVHDDTGDNCALSASRACSRRRSNPPTPAHKLSMHSPAEDCCKGLARQRGKSVTRREQDHLSFGSGPRSQTASPAQLGIGFRPRTCQLGPTNYAPAGPILAQ